MQAALMYGPNDIRVEEIEKPKCPEGGFVLKVMAVGLIFAILQLIPNLVNTLIFMVMRLLVSSMRFLLPAPNIKLVTVCIFILLIIVCNVSHVELAIVKCVKILEII